MFSLYTFLEVKNMETTITERGQTAVPAMIRKRFHLKPHTKLEWVVTSHGISVIPIPEDPIKEFRGIFKGSGLTESLLKERAKERERERGQKKR